MLHQHAALDRSLMVSLDVAPEVPAKLVFDGTRVRQCLGNLLSNAIKFSEHGSVMVSVRLLGDKTPRQVEIAVADRGIGVPPQDQDIVFDPYSQARSRSDCSAGGIGLGLAITRRLARLMRGDATYAPRPGGGSIFRLVFDVFEVPMSGAAGRHAVSVRVSS